jgi:hypothetical protein
MANFRRKLTLGAMKLSLACFAGLFGLLLGELACRILFEPIDFLKPVVVQDEVIGHRIEGGSAGHDAWGYRNRAVPEQAEIVAIGDSQTYGVAASAANSWPAWMDRMREEAVYNLAQNGYGPVQYLYMLENQALGLSPSTIVVGFYFGNDFYDTWATVYRYDAWKQLRDERLVESFRPALETLRVRQERPLGLAKKTKEWLSHHSILYRKVDYSPIGQWLHRVQQILPQETDVNHLFQDVEGTVVEFRPRTRLGAVDLEDPRIQEGLRISQVVLAEMHDTAVEREIRFVLALIPTKERVFGDYLLEVEHAETLAIVERLIENEDRSRAAIRGFAEARGIEVIDLLPPLKAVAGEAKIYPKHTEGHPNAEGYRVIAEAISRQLGGGAVATR